MINDMKAVKMLGLTGVLSGVIVELRRVELETSERFRVLRISRILVCEYHTHTAPMLVLTKASKHSHNICTVCNICSVCYHRSGQ